MRSLAPAVTQIRIMGRKTSGRWGTESGENKSTKPQSVAKPMVITVAQRNERVSRIRWNSSFLLRTRRPELMSSVKKNAPAKAARTSLKRLVGIPGTKWAQAI